MKIKKLLALLVVCGLLLPVLGYSQQRPLSVLSINGMVVTLSNGSQFYVHSNYAIPFRYWRLGVSVYVSRPHYYMNQYGYTISTPNAQVIFVTRMPNTSQIQLQNYLFNKADRQRQNMQNLMLMYFLMRQSQTQNQYQKQYRTPTKRRVARINRDAKITAISSLSTEKQRVQVECADNGSSFWITIHARIEDRPSLGQKVMLKYIGSKTYVAFTKKTRYYVLKYSKD